MTVICINAVTYHREVIYSSFCGRCKIHSNLSVRVFHHWFISVIVVHPIWAVESQSKDALLGQVFNHAQKLKENIEMTANNEMKIFFVRFIVEYYT